MKGLRLEDGLLLTEIKIVFNDKTLELNRVLVDTCSTESKLSLDNAEKLTIPITNSDADEKFSTGISVGPLRIADFPINVAPLRNESLDGILGLDFLKRVGAKINFDSMTLSGSRVQ